MYVWTMTGGHPGLVCAAGLHLFSKDGSPRVWAHSTDTPWLQSAFLASTAMQRLRTKLTSLLGGVGLPVRYVLLPLTQPHGFATLGNTILPRFAAGVWCAALCTRC
jgi:hypothetical protein